MLENVDTVHWNELRHAFGDATDVPDMLRAINSATDTQNFLEQYSNLMASINHQGDIYDSTGYVVPFIIQMLKQSTDPFRTIHHLIMLAELLRHTSHHHYQQPSFPQSIVPHRQLLHVYEATKAGINHYLKLLSHEDEHVRAGSVYVLSFLVDEYTSILPAVQHCVEHSQNDWLRAGGSWAYATVASYEIAIARDAKIVTNIISERLQILEAWSHDTQQIVRFAAAISYISVLASDWSRHNASTPDYIVELVAQSLSVNMWDKLSSFDNEPSHIRYVYSEITPFNDMQKLVIRWCQQADNPMRWVTLMARLTLSPIKAHEFVREMLDTSFARLGIHQHTHRWHNHPTLDQLELSDAVTYTFAEANRHYTNSKSLSDNQRLVLQTICDCEPFWELSTNLLSFYYGLPDEREALCELSNKKVD